MYKVTVKSIDSPMLGGQYRAWGLDSPKNGILEGDKIHFAGWILENFSQEIDLIIKPNSGDDVICVLDRKRPDVIRKILGINSPENHEDITCGFSLHLQIEPKCYSIGFQVDETFWPLAEVVVIELEKVLVGSGGHLFLDNDANRSVEQFKGDLLIEDAIQKKWTDYLSKVNLLARNAHVSLHTIIAPSKEELFAEFYPFQRGNVTPIDQLLNLSSDRHEVIYPLKELSESRDLSYLRNDTHWTDFGAKLVVEIFLRRVGLANFSKYLPSTFYVCPTYGDLGNKLANSQSALALFANYDQKKPRKVFDNGLMNSGRIWIYESEEAPVDHSLVIFGGSSSMWLAPLLSLIFNRVVYAHSPAVWSQFIVDYERPSYVILQTNQRFIISAPNIKEDVWAAMGRKIRSMDPAKIRALEGKMLKQKHTFNAPYAERILALTHNIVPKVW